MDKINENAINIRSEHLKQQRSVQITDSISNPPNVYCLDPHMASLQSNSKKIPTNSNLQSILCGCCSGNQQYNITQRASNTIVYDDVMDNLKETKLYIYTIITNKLNSSHIPQSLCRPSVGGVQ
eukprot:775790_1